MSKGFEEMGRSWFSLTQGTVEQGVATWKALMAARNLREVMELQNEYARTTFDQWVNEGTRLSETALKVANEAWAPLNGRLGETVERVTKPAA
jgi:phasin family protein